MLFPKELFLIRDRNRVDSDGRGDGKQLGETLKYIRKDRSSKQTWCSFDIPDLNGKPILWSSKIAADITFLEEIIQRLNQHSAFYIEILSD